MVHYVIMLQTRLHFMIMMVSLDLMSKCILPGTMRIVAP
jgi:hypothetical protein